MSLPRSQSRPILQCDKDSYEPLHRNWLLFFFYDQSDIAVRYWPFAQCDLSYFSFFFSFCHSMYLTIYNCILALPIFFYIDLRDAKYARFDYKTVTYTYLFVSKM